MELALAFIIGVLFGSFLNVVILRVPKDESIVFGASHCPKCKNILEPWHNIPIFSWLFLKGRCAFCGEKISIQYPIIELLGGIIFLAMAYKFSLSPNAFLIACSFLTLLALSAIDLKYKMVPDSLNLLAMLFAIFGAWSFSGVLSNFQNALLFAGGFTLLRFALSYVLTKKAHNEAKKYAASWSKNYHIYPFIEAMGEGDIMVAATMGALLGVKLTLVAIFLSALLALPVLLFVQNRSKEEQRVPFVPFLVIATFIVYIYDSPILRYIEANY